METFSIQLKDGKIHIPEFSDAARIIVLTGPKAKRVADLFLHKIDLDFAAECLKRIDMSKTDLFSNEVFWRCAIIHFFKCFGDSVSRFSLISRSIFKSHGHLALEIFDFFKSLRDEHYVHDQNSALMAMPLAVIASESAGHNIDKIIVPGFRADLLDEAQFNNFSNLVFAALGWIEKQFDILAEKLTEDLEAMPRKLLMSMKEAEYSIPTLSEVFLTRHSKGKT